MNGDPELAFELAQMIERDQRARLRYIADTSDDELAREVALVDRDHRSRIEEIIRTRGWPGYSLVGEHGSAAAFGLVAHASRELWDLAIPLLRAAVDRGDADESHYARLLDRSLKAKALPQEYGTQMDYVDGAVVVPAVRDPETVDARRASAGLPSMEEQRRQIEARFG